MTLLVGLCILGAVIIFIFAIFASSDFRDPPGPESNFEFERKLLPLRFDTLLPPSKELEDMQIKSLKALHDDNLSLAIKFQGEIINSCDSPIPHINLACLAGQYNENLLHTKRITPEEFQNNQNDLRSRVDWAQEQIENNPDRFQPEVSKYLESLKGYFR